MNAVEYLSRAEAIDITDRVMADMDCFTDWLGANCMDSRYVSSERICRNPARFEMRLADADVAEVLHLLLNDDEQRIVFAARNELRRRWLDEQGETLFQAKRDRYVEEVL